MKKVLAAILLIVYFTVSTGFVVSLHYCMDRLASTSLFDASAEKCDRCGMDMHASDGCCRNEMQIVKLENDQNTIAGASYALNALEQQFSVPSLFIVAAFENVNYQKHFHNHSPPLLSAQDTYLQNNVFRI